LDWRVLRDDWSVNPTWRPAFKPLPTHAITRGVKPANITDEWYFHMRFREGQKGVLPILAAVPPASTMDRPDGPHEGQPGGPRGREARRTADCRLGLRAPGRRTRVWLYRRPLPPELGQR